METEPGGDPWTPPTATTSPAPRPLPSPGDSAAKASLSPHHFSFLCLLQLGLSQPPPHHCPQPDGILAKQRGMEGRRGCLDGISDLWIPDAGPGGGSGSLPPASRIPAHLPGKRTPALPVHRPGLGRCHPGKGSRVASSSAGRGWDGPPQARFCSVGGSDYNDSGACFSSISCEQGPGLRSQYASSHLFLKTGPGPLPTTNFPSATKVDRKRQSHCYPPY